MRKYRADAIRAHHFFFLLNDAFFLSESIKNIHFTLNFFFRALMTPGLVLMYKKKNNKI